MISTPHKFFAQQFFLPCRTHLGTIRTMEKTQYHIYKLTLHTSQEHNDILNFSQRYPQLDIRNEFPSEEYLGFYPVYFTVMVIAGSPIELAFLIMFPHARLRTIMHTSASALG